MVIPVAAPVPQLQVQDLGRWTPAADRRNPIAVLQEQEADRLPWLVPVRHSRMAHDAFAFYRGTPAVMAHDLGNAPAQAWRCSSAATATWRTSASTHRLSGAWSST